VKNEGIHSSTLLDPQPDRTSLLLARESELVR
jgi:hypothetical protein